MSLEDGPRIYTCTGGLEPVGHSESSEPVEEVTVDVDELFGDEDEPYAPEGSLPKDHRWVEIVDPSTGKTEKVPLPIESSDASQN